jgi:hypothetical protein
MTYSRVLLRARCFARDALRQAVLRCDREWMRLPRAFEMANLLVSERSGNEAIARQQRINAEWQLSH